MVSGTGNRGDGIRVGTHRLPFRDGPGAEARVSEAALSRSEPTEFPAARRGQGADLDASFRDAPPRLLPSRQSESEARDRDAGLLPCGAGGAGAAAGNRLAARIPLRRAHAAFSGCAGREFRHCGGACAHHRGGRASRNRRRRALSDGRCGRQCAAHRHARHDPQQEGAVPNLGKQQLLCSASRRATSSTSGGSTPRMRGPDGCSPRRAASIATWSRS